nr:hypothetical protein [Pseudactinotalea sp. HY160]
MPFTDGTVECVVTNTPRTGNIVVTKKWVVQDSAGNVVETYDIPADASTLPAGLHAQLTLDGQNRAWGANDSRTIGSVVTIDEVATLDGDALPGCSILEPPVLTFEGTVVTFAPTPGEDYGLPFDATVAAGTSRFHITNTIECTQSLSLVKQVDVGAVTADTWTLSATKPDGSAALEGPSGTYSPTTPVTAAVTATVPYALAEAGGPATYVPDGGWVCATSDSEAVAVTDGAVEVPLGADVTCTITNTTALLTVLKHIDGSSDLSPSDWDLTATPDAGVAGLTPTTVPGADGAATDPNAASTFEVRPGHGYSLAEALAAGHEDTAYLQLALQHWDGAEWVDVDADTVSVEAGAHDVYRFVNAGVTAISLPLTGGLGTDLFLALGALGLIAAVALAGWQHRRTTRMRRA